MFSNILSKNVFFDRWKNVLMYFSIIITICKDINNTENKFSTFSFPFAKFF